MTRQPYMGLGLLFPRLRGLVHLWQFGDQPTGRAVQLNPDVTVRAIWQSHQETRVRNGLLILLTSTTSSIHARKVLLHAVNLRHGTDGFTSPPKEVVLRIFITLLSNPRTLGPVASTLTTSPPRATATVHTDRKVISLLFSSHRARLVMNKNITLYLLRTLYF
jgi:hypothetical protein